MGYPIKMKLHNTAVFFKWPEIWNAAFFSAMMIESKKLLGS